MQLYAAAPLVCGFTTYVLEEPSDTKSEEFIELKYFWEEEEQLRSDYVEKYLTQLAIDIHLMHLSNWIIIIYLPKKKWSKEAVILKKIVGQ